MEKIKTIQDIQRMEQGILDYVANICEENELRYFLAGGTLLGAIRHQGFIPWDNDIDISMPRPDYNKLISIVEKKPDERYRLLRVTNENDYYYPFIKVVDTKTKLIELAREDRIDDMGIFLDIFPLDTISKNHNKALRELRYVNKWGSRIAGSVSFPIGISYFRKIEHYLWYWLLKMLNREKSLNRVEKRLYAEKFGNTGYIVSTYGLRNENEIIEYEAFAQTVELPFEGKMYKCPIGYDKYLKQMYGNYMELPPERERIAPHDIEVYMD
ncbi:LicD family protein [Eubacterium sp. MSJ-13]|uniref:LicD family protein n=1 Tax=Eubacterium sp. MSJ-13 TaxID=2841513 RepID=UPI001C0F5F03|nr:LicD family protein [Eubacterium sp. MSJ-13]MBU5478966.1 LicD family protein [Eubacterium sp. MSJ-13]